MSAKIDLDELERKACAVNHPRGWWPRSEESRRAFKVVAPSDQEFISACDPVTVGGLIDRIRELEAALAESCVYIRAPISDLRALLEKGAVRRG